MKKIILASNSPRRKEILELMGLPFVVKTTDVSEDYPATMDVNEVAEYLAIKKASALKDQIGDDEVVIAADTVVIINNRILGKPVDVEEARLFLNLLSSNQHTVKTGVCLYTSAGFESFTSSTEVHFHPITAEEIDFYIQQYQPFDKAGSYGAQDWLGVTKIKQLIGSYFNVMGLPSDELYTRLINL